MRWMWKSECSSLLPCCQVFRTNRRISDRAPLPLLFAVLCALQLARWWCWCFFFFFSVQRKRERERDRAARESLLIRRVEPVFHMSNNPKEGPFIMAPCEIYICLALITDLSGWRSPQFKDGLLYCWGAKCMGFWGVYFSPYFCQFVWPRCRIAAFPHRLHGYVRVYWLCIPSWEEKAERAVRWVTECHYKWWLKAAYEDL